MKKTGLVVTILFSLLLTIGCWDVQPPFIESPGEALPVLTKPAPEILTTAAPVRDPFSVGGSSPRQKKGGIVERKGRNPFLPALADAEPEEPEEVVPPVPTEPEEEPVPTEPEEEPVPTEPEEEPVPTDEAPPGGLVIVLRTIDRSWLDVFVDGRRVLRSNVASQETLRWEAEREIVLQQVGREHAVRLTVNGKDFGLLRDVAQRLAAGEDLSRQAGVRISLERRHPGGVLVGLRFSALAGE